MAALVPAAVRQTRKEEEAGRRTQRNLRPHVHLRRHRLCDRDDVLCLHVPWTFGAKSARRWGGEDLQKLILNKGGVQTDLVHCPGGEGVSGEMGGDSLFFDYDCPLRTKKRDDIVLDIDWSTRAGEPAPRAQGDSWLCSPADRASPGAGESESPKLVVGTSDNRLSLFQDEGHPVETMEPPARESSPTCVSWGPAPHHLLAAGWHDGAVTLWDEKTSMMRQDLEVHKRSSVTLLKWSPCGSRLVSADQEGNLGVWEPETHGGAGGGIKLIPICKIPPRKGAGAVTHVVFRTNDPRPAERGRAGLAAPSFYFAGEDGAVYLGCDDQSRVTEVMRMKNNDEGVSPTMVLMYYHDVDQIVGMNEQLLLYRAHGPSEAGTNEVLPRVKLAARAPDPDRTMHALWVNAGLLLTSSNEGLLRFWKLASDENFVLRIEDVQVPPDDAIQAVAYSEHLRLLCAGTAKGYVLFWRQTAAAAAGEYDADDWQPLLHATTKLPQAVEALKWAPGHGLLAVQMESACSILIQLDLVRKQRDGCALVQLSNKHLGFANMVRARDHLGKAEPSLEDEGSRQFWAGQGVRPLAQITSQSPIKGCDCNATKIVMWSGYKAEVHGIDLASGAHSPLSDFQTKAHNIVISSDKPNEDAYLFMAVKGRIEVANLQGYVTRSLPLGDLEGDPMLLDMHGDFLVSSSSNGALRLWDVSKATPESRCMRYFPPESEHAPRTLEMTAVRVNKAGTRVSILARRLAAAGAGADAAGPDTHLHVYDVESDSFLSYDCGPSYFPVAHAWPSWGDAERGADATDKDSDLDRLLSCEVRRVYEARQAATDVQVKTTKAQAMLFFATANRGLLLQQRLALELDGQVMLGLNVPHIFLAAPTDSHSSALCVTAPVMRDFVGMADAASEDRDALLKFSYCMTLGNMDEAYKAIKTITTPALWENMAKMCVTTDRLDVAEQCLSKMGNAAGSQVSLIQTACRHHTSHIAQGNIDRHFTWQCRQTSYMAI